MDTFLDERFLKQLEKIKLMTQKGVKGPHRGEHKSWRSGEGSEFLDYRSYQIGDDLRYVDWSVYGRFEKLFIKLFHAEENQTIHLLLDISNSMGFGNPSKLVGAKKFAAAISYICLANLDRVTVASFADTLDEFKSAVRGKRRYADILHFLHRLEPKQATDLNACLTDYAAIGRFPGIVVVLTDLFDPNGYEDGLKALAYRNFDVHLIHVLDREELAWTQTGSILLRDMETGEKRATFIDANFAKLYQQKIEAFLANARQFCDTYNMNYYVFNTSLAFEEVLIDYLNRSAVNWKM